MKEGDLTTVKGIFMRDGIHLDDGSIFDAAVYSRYYDTIINKEAFFIITTAPTSLTVDPRGYLNVIKDWVFIDEEMKDVLRSLTQCEDSINERSTK